MVCLDRKTGAETWRYWTAGPLMGSPTCWQGRIFAGSCDGWVYCLDAAAGALIWRFRVAPEERRIMVWGHLSSAWPILANVLVQDGVVFAAAGVVSQLGGTVLCALDARTGRLRWETRFNVGNPKLQPPSLIPSASGQLAWYSGRLWWHVGDTGILVVDPASGAVRPAADSEQFRKKQGGTWYGSRGQDIGVLPGGWVVYGGRQFNLPLSDLQPRNHAAFLRASPEGALTDESGCPKVLVLKDFHEVDSLPAWDANETLLSGRPAGWQIAQLNPMLIRNLGEALAEKSSARPEGQWNSGVRMMATLAPAPGQQQPVFPEGVKFRNFLSPILAANAVVFLTGEGQQWRVVAVDRAEHKLCWDVRLPGRPMMNSLSLTRTGDALVPLIDGRLVCVGAAASGEK